MDKAKLEELPPKPIFVHYFEHRTARLRLNNDKTKYIEDSVPKQYNPNRKNKSK